jgi:hypothetical protein
LGEADPFGHFLDLQLVLLEGEGVEQTNGD